MKINEMELSKLKELKKKTKMLKDERQKGKVIYKILDIVVVVVLAVISRGGDYCIALKANQGNFYKDVKDYFDEDRLLII